MRRREFIALAGGAALMPLGARAQPGRVRRLGILLFAKPDQAIVAPFLAGLEQLGYVAGKNIAIDYRDAGGLYERLPEVAEELVRLNPDVILAFGGDVAPIAKQTTSTIPIVAVVSNDPVASGLVESLRRPGGNVTGLTQVHDLLAGKAIELLRDVVPGVSRVAILWNPDHADPEFRETQRASTVLGMELHSLEVRTLPDFDIAFQAAARERVEALIVIVSRIVFVNRKLVGEFAQKNQLILVGVPTWLMEVGALLSYGPNVPELFRRASVYADKILKGARPSDLPMEQPTTFELVINVSKAKSLGITIPQGVLARADKIVD